MDTVEAYNAILRSGSRPLYELAVLTATIVGGLLIRQDSRSWPLPDTVRWKILGVAAVGSLVCCALPAFFAGGYVGARANDFLMSPKTILGGILGGFLLVAVYKRTAGIAFDTSDAFARGGCLMMAIGRLGCAAQHCCFGKPTHRLLGIDYGDGVPRIPVQAIEACLMFCLFAVLNVMHRRNSFTNRRLFILFASYGVLRFGLEFFRENIATQFLGVGFYQWIALGLMVVGIYQIIKRTRRQQRATSVDGVPSTSEAYL